MSLVLPYDHPGSTRPTEDYEDGVIPEGVDPDIVRTEKQLDFEEAKRSGAWCADVELCSAAG